LAQLDPSLNRLYN